MKVKTTSVSEVKRLCYSIGKADIPFLVQAEKDIMEERKEIDPSKITGQDVMARIVRSYPLREKCKKQNYQ